MGLGVVESENAGYVAFFYEAAGRVKRSWFPSVPFLRCRLLVRHAGLARFHHPSIRALEVAS